MKRAETCIGSAAPFREWALTGPSVSAAGPLPVRGDLAHIRLAGLHFVPHYAVPMPHLAGSDGATVRSMPGCEADSQARLKPGDRFAVLDIAGNWAWGQVQGEDRADAEDASGPVGYVMLDELEQAGS